MIDYDKLKLAHSIGNKLHFGDWEIKFIYSNQDKYYVLTFTDDDSLWNEECYKSIDDLITKLHELTQPKAEYKDVYYVGAGGHIRQTVALNQDGYMFCDDTNPDALGLHITCYPTKQSLIEAQIDYWTELQKQFDIEYALSEEGQAKIREGLR